MSQRIRFEWPRAVRESSLPASTKVVGLVLATYMSPLGRAFPSVATLMAGASVSRRTVQTGLRRLEREGFLVAERRSKRTTIYEARIPDGRK